MDNKGSIKYKLSKLVNIIIFAVSVILILLATIFRELQVVFTVLISIGTSLLATSIVTHLNLLYAEEKDSISSILNLWAITGLYKQRAEINIETNSRMRNTKKLDICAMGLKNFRDAQTSAVIKQVKHGMRIRILTIDPNSKLLPLIDEKEKKPEGDTKQSILALIDWVDSIKKNQKRDDQVQIKIYDHYPSDFYFNMDGVVWTGPYQAKESQQTVTFKFEKDGLGAEYFKQNFEDLWKNAKEL